MSVARLLCAGLMASVSLAVAAPASAQAPPPPAMTSFAADASDVGVISLIFWGARGHSVRFYERIGDERRPLGIAKAPPTTTATVLKEATTWDCNRLERHFEARVRLPDGTVATGEYGVRTASCAQRFRLDAPPRVKPGETARVRVVDRWNIGEISPKLCITPPESERACKTLKFARAVALGTRRFRVKRKGRWRVELRIGDHRVRRSIAVGEDTKVGDVAPPTVLATGDSTMQGIDSFLTDELGDDATLVSDVQLGSSISRGSYWPKHARQQVKRYHPRVTVMSVGAAIDAYPLPTPAGKKVKCCDALWISLYAGRVRAMMQTYLRGGRGRVFWLTPPVPRDAERLKITVAVNEAIERAAEGLEGVTVIRVDQYFSPDGVYQEVIRYRGRDVRVRDADGVHLNISGTAIMAQFLTPSIRELLVRMDTST
jgi:hypothetical protein